MLASNLSNLRERFNALARATLPAEALHPILRLDAEVTLAEITFPFLKSLDQIHPVGQGNPCTQFAARGLRLTGHPRRLGSEQQHLRFNVTDGATTHQAIWWNCKLPELPPAFDLAFAPELSEYNGTVAIQLKVLDLKPT